MSSGAEGVNELKQVEELKQLKEVGGSYILVIRLEHALWGLQGRVGRPESEVGKERLALVVLVAAAVGASGGDGLEHMCGPDVISESTAVVEAECCLVAEPHVGQRAVGVGLHAEA